MAKPYWEQLLEHPDRIDPASGAMQVLADAGDAAYRAALQRWNLLRHSDDRDAHAGIALVLADAFDDYRAVDEIAATWPETFPEQFAWRTFVAPPSEPVRAAFGPKAIAELRTWMESGTAADLPDSAARAARTLRADDEGEVYLPARRLLIERTADSDPNAGERVADELLIAAAAATPEHDEVRRAVLSYWGQEQPVDAVPTAEPGPGESPASWTATCELIARSTDAAFADRVIAIAATHEDAWRGAGFDAETYVRALEQSAGDTADETLLDVAKAQVPASGLAVRSLAARRRPLAGAEPPLAARLDAIVAGMRESGILDAPLGKRTRLALAERRTEDENPQAVAIEVAEALGRPTGDELALEWASFASWLETAELPGPTPVPAAPPKRDDRGDGGLLGRLFGRG